MSPTTPTQSAAKRRHAARTLLVVLVSAVVTAGLCTWAALAVPDSASVLVAWSTGVAAVLLTAAAGLAAWGLQTASYYRTRAEKADGAAGKLADETLPALVTRLRSGSSVDTALAEIEHPRNPAFQRILRTLGQELARLLPAVADGRHDHVADVVRVAEPQDHAVGDLAREAQHAGREAGEVDR